MNDNQVKFQNLLRELFQFDCADLDFGIYRIMNYKRAVIERFITEDLPKAIAEELEQGALAEQAKVQEALGAARQKVLEALGDDALDAEGNLAEQYRESKVGKEYLAAQQQAAGSRSREALEASVYNHLYTFFSRYWQDGDFISKRRYSKKERYAIPYNGEEVYLYWANHDQYYIKTGEYFTDYTYKAPNGVTVHFKLHQADVEQNNVKGEKRFFLPLLKEIAWDEAARQVIVPFEYRPLTEQEAITYSQKNQQEAIIARAATEIPRRLKAVDALAALTAEKRTDADGNSVSYLEHHLRQYTRRNTSDFFIHKDLKGFLSRELDFYLKNEVLNLEEMEAAGEQLSEGWFQLLRLIKRVGAHIIEFLAQIEEFQKMLWGKRKFVTETFYCITIGKIPESFYPEIAACEAQWDEWKALFDLDAPKATKKRAELLRTHPTLVLDTRHFPPDFTDRLLASFKNLDEMTDGLLVHSENWQALNLLQEKYRERVKCIYIDPPYNTGSDEFLYRDNYQHSSWLAMMADRFALAKGWMEEDGLFFASIDDNEAHRLRFLTNSTLGGENYLAELVWDLGTGTAAGHFTRAHEYILSYAKDKSRLPNFRYSGPPEKISERAIKKVSKGNPASQITFPAGIEFEGRDATFEGEFGDSEVIRVIGGKMIFKDGKLVEPVTLEAGWAMRNQILSWLDGRETFDSKGQRVIRFFFDAKGRLQYEKERGFVNPQSILRQIASTRKGSEQIEAILGKGLVAFPKPVELIQFLVQLVSDSEDWVMDFFAGSGTTGHAVINLNREDGGRRKFILVEMAQYFDTVLLPRIKKVTFTPEWKDGKPKRMATPEEAERSPRIVKVIRLESYEDALNNLTFDDASSQQALELFRDDYLLSYMLKWETRHSETLLNVEKLQSPFSYKLHLHRDGETRERPVDLPETFNYLLGLDVQTRRVYPGNAGVSPAHYLVYRGTLRNGRTVVVLWRETRDWTERDYRRERDFVKAQKLTEGADEIYTNGDSYIPGARSLDGLFKARMFAPVEA